MAKLQPTVLWAQRADRLLLTIDLQQCKDPQISIKNDEAAKAGRLTFRGQAHSHATGPDEHAYGLDLELHGEIDDTDIKQLTTERYITLAIAKKELGHWPRLLKAAGKPAPNIKVDWDKWVDEDDEEEAGAGGDMGGFDMSMLQNFQNFGGGMGGMPGMPGMGGMGGMDLSGFGGSDDEEEGAGGAGADSDDDLPDLEPVPQA